LGLGDLTVTNGSRESTPIDIIVGQHREFGRSENAGFVTHGELSLVLSAEQADAPDLFEVHTNRV
jgi:hypothetical protein